MKQRISAIIEGRCAILFRVELHMLTRERCDPGPGRRPSTPHIR
jgi:hypothetical protein